MLRRTELKIEAEKQMRFALDTVDAPVRRVDPTSYLDMVELGAIPILLNPKGLKITASGETKLIWEDRETAYRRFGLSRGDKLYVISVYDNAAIAIYIPKANEEILASKLIMKVEDRYKELKELERQRGDELMLTGVALDILRQNGYAYALQHGAMLDLYADENVPSPVKTAYVRDAEIKYITKDDPEYAAVLEANEELAELQRFVDFDRISL